MKGLTYIGLRSYSVCSVSAIWQDMQDKSPADTAATAGDYKKFTNSYV